MPINQVNLQPDLRLATALDASLRMILSDMASIRNTGAVLNLGSINGTGADTSRIRFAGLGATDAFSTIAPDGTAVTETALVDASADIAVVRGALMREITDLATLTGYANDVNPASLAASMAASYERYFNQQVAAAVSTLGTDVTAAAGLTVDDYYDAIFTLELASVPGPYFAMLAPVQVANLQESLRAEGGAVQFMPATAEMLQIKGQGYVGDLLGVSIFKSSDVTTAAGDREGGMWGLGAFGYKTGTMQTPIGAVVTSPNSEIVVEFNRNAAAGITEIVGNAYLGVGLIEDARGVGLNSDA